MSNHDLFLVHYRRVIVDVFVDISLACKAGNDSSHLLVGCEDK